jgi:hypothetical protein
MTNNSLTRDRSLKNTQMRVASIANFKPSDYIHLHGERPRFLRRARWRFSQDGLQNLRS